MNTWVISPNGWAWALLGIAAASLFIIALCSIILTVQAKRTRREIAFSPIRNHNRIGREASSANWIIYIWFTIGIILLIFAMFDYDDGIKVRAQESTVSTVLSILVTFLVAWQIWQTMMSRHEVERTTAVLHRIQELETELNERSTIFTQRNMELTHLIDAHAHLQSARDASQISEAYSHFANALIRFASSNVSFEYVPLQQSIQGLHDSLIALESEGDNDDIDWFIESMDEYNNLYDELVASIHRREQDIARLHREIIGIREERLALRDRLLERRSQEDAESTAESLE